MKPSRVLAAIVLAGLAGASQAALDTYTDRATWVAAIGGDPTVFDFEDYPALSSFSTGDPTVKANYNARGIDFLPFANGAFPLVRQGDGANTTSGTYWLGNQPAIGFNEAANAIRFSFLVPVRWFGFYDVGSDDGYKVRAYDNRGLLLGSGDILETSGTPKFWGFNSTAFNITTVTLTPTSGNGYIGLDNLQIAAPEPATWALMVVGLGLIASGAVRARQRC